MEKRRPIRILLAKAGADGHDVGVKVLAYALRDGGMEVIYTGLHQTPEQIVQTTLQENVNVVGLSILSGAHVPIVEKVGQLMKEAELKDVLLVVGGTIPLGDIPILKGYGAAEVFPSHSRFDDIIDFIKRNVKAGVA
jgi:methylmalonyl-CoA mutase C-terminal domain/subunit